MEPLLWRRHVLRLVFISTFNSDTALNLLCLGGSKQLYFSFLLCFFPLSWSAPLWSLTQAFHSVGVLGALLVNQWIIPIALWLWPSLLLRRFVIGKSHLPRHSLWDTPRHTHTHSPEGGGEIVHITADGPSSPAIPRAWESPRCTNIYKHSQKQPVM